MLVQIAGFAGLAAGRMDTIPPAAMRAAIEAIVPTVENSVRQNGPNALAIVDTASFAKVVRGAQWSGGQWRDSLALRSNVFAMPRTVTCGDECPRFVVKAVITKGDSAVVTFDLVRFRWSSGERVFSASTYFVTLVRKDSTYTAKAGPGIGFGHGFVRPREELED